MTGQPTRLERQSRRSPQAYVRATPTRMGVLVPWANTTVEDELHLWSDRTAWHYARLAPASGITALEDSFLQGLVDAIPDALFQLSALPLQGIYLACTSAAFTRPDQVAAFSASGRVPVVSAFHAIVTYLNARRLTRITLATPYPHAITEVELSQFAAHGITVLDAISLGLTDGYADITTQQITEPALEMTGKSGGDALVLSCTGWPTRAAVSILRDQLDRPVISSNSAIAAHALRGQP